jgi:phosphatidylserine/phosphatidylglycerophosphate/cardiolipin synthase-like enzyme
MDILIDSLDTPEERIVFVKAPYIVHAKVTIIDDLWASIGSSNCWRRSFYMDGEINVSVLDEADPSFAAQLRKDLWGHHCGKLPGADCDPLLPLNDALGIWRPSWGTPPTDSDGNQFKLRDDLEKKTIPFVFVPPPAPPATLPPEVFPGRQPPAPPRPESLTEGERDRTDGDSRLEY